MTDASRPATGYPAPPHNGYPPPQQQNYYYPNHNPYNHQQYYPSQPRATFFRRFFAALIAVFIIFGVILLIVWLVLRPKIPSFSVQSLSVSSLNLTSSPPPQISASFSLHFSVANPNHKLHVYYDEIEARLFYRNSLIAFNQLPPFDQATKNLTTMDATLVASSAYLDATSANKFNADRSRGTVKFDVQVMALVRFKAGGWRARRRFLRVFCDNLNVGFSGNSSKGILFGGPYHCAVGI